MKGLSNTIDWVKLTAENRILDNGKLFKDCADTWQYEVNQGLTEYQRIYLQFPRGHDKTDNLAWWSLLWLSTTENCRGYAAGVDRDNAKLFRDSSRKIKGLHPELFKDIFIEKHVVFSKKTGSYIETISSDADSAYGLNFDLLIINDFHAWPDKTFWEVLWTACEKKQGIRVWIESNALTLGSEGAFWVKKQRDWVQKHSWDGYRKIGNKSAEWFYYNPPKYLASWQIHKVQQWQETLHPLAFRRLIENKDTAGEESYVTPEQIEAITTGQVHLGWKDKSEKKGYIVTAIDLGIKKDSTAIATIQSLPVEKGVPPTLILLALDVITGSIDEPVLLRNAEKIFLDHQKRFFSNPILIDPWNAADIIQRYPSKVAEWPFTARHVQELTQTLYRVIADKNLIIYKDAGFAFQDGEDWTLQKELINAVIKDTSYGQRVDHKSGGYSDRLMAVGMCVHYLMNEVNIPKIIKTEEIKPEEENAKIIREWLQELRIGKMETLRM